jgi:hypothetical protein
MNQSGLNGRKIVHGLPGKKKNAYRNIRTAMHCVVVTRLSGIIYNTYTSTHALIVSQPCIRSSH